MLQGLPILLPQVQAGYRYENLVNETQVDYLLVVLVIMNLKKIKN